jgi:hypothetical protein
MCCAAPGFSKDLRFNFFVLLILGNDMVKLGQPESAADVTVRPDVLTSPWKSKWSSYLGSPQRQKNRTSLSSSVAELSVTSRGNSRASRRHRTDTTVSCFAGVEDSIDHGWGED